MSMLVQSYLLEVLDLHKTAFLFSSEKKNGKVNCYVLIYFIVWRKKKRKKVKCNTLIFPFFSFTGKEIILTLQEWNLHFELTSQKQSELQIRAETCCNLDLQRMKTKKCIWEQEQPKPDKQTFSCSNNKITQKIMQGKKKKKKQSDYFCRHFSVQIILYLFLLPD